MLLKLFACRKRLLLKAIKVVIAVSIALIIILHRNQLSIIDKLLLTSHSTFAIKTVVQSSSQTNDSKGISNNKVNLLNSTLSTKTTTHKASTPTTTTTHKVSTPTTTTTHNVSTPTTTTTHKVSTPTTITSTLKTTNDTVKHVNSTAKKPQSKDYFSNYKFINKHSKRYNTAVDLRPKIILGSINKYKDLAEFDKMKQIPQIIHQTNKNEIVSVVYKKWMQSWLKFNPNWQYWFWTDEDIKKLITTRYPDFKAVFFGYKMPVMKADVFRYFVLHEFGGIYVDCDMECLKPLDAKMAEHDCIVSLEPAIQSLILYNREDLTSNAFMASRPRHPFFKFVIDYLSENNRHNHGDPVHSTGPKLLGSAYNEISINTKEDLPYLPDPDVYQPKADPRRVPDFVKACKDLVGKFNTKANPKKAEETCKPFLGPQADNGPKNNSYAIHHWIHSWWASHKVEQYGFNKEERTFSVRELLN